MSRCVQTFDRYCKSTHLYICHTKQMYILYDEHIVVALSGWLKLVVYASPSSCDRDVWCCPAGSLYQRCPWIMCLLSSDPDCVPSSEISRTPPSKSSAAPSVVLVCHTVKRG